MNWCKYKCQGTSCERETGVRSSRWEHLPSFCKDRCNELICEQVMGIILHGSAINITFSECTSPVVGQSYLTSVLALRIVLILILVLLTTTCYVIFGQMRTGPVVDQRNRIYTETQGYEYLCMADRKLFIGMRLTVIYYENLGRMSTGPVVDQRILILTGIHGGGYLCLVSTDLYCGMREITSFVAIFPATSAEKVCEFVLYLGEELCRSFPYGYYTR